MPIARYDTGEIAWQTWDIQLLPHSEYSLVPATKASCIQGPLCACTPLLLHDLLGTARYVSVWQRYLNLLHPLSSLILRGYRQVDKRDAEHIRHVPGKTRKRHTVPYTTERNASVLNRLEVQRAHEKKNAPRQTRRQIYPPRSW